jgi:hypothetical protein
MLRKQYIELVRRQIYGGYVPEDAEITVNLVNNWLNHAIGIAAQRCYTDNLKMEGIAYVNGSFYTTYKGITIVKNETNLYRATMPHIPLGLGRDEGFANFLLKDTTANKITYPIVWITQQQRGLYQGLRSIPNKVLCYSEGIYVYIISTITLTDYTVSVTMISGGDSTDLAGELNVPDDYIPIMTEYLKQQLSFERSQPVDTASGDGQDFIAST